MEIERKFLVKQLPNLHNFESKTIEQHYINFKPEIRVRKIDNDFMLTIKSSGNLKRKEIEFEITEKQYDELKSMAGLDSIIKTRYYIPYKSFTCELDVYHNIDNLITVEVEFEIEEDSKKFLVPEWFGDEITYLKEFKNQNLARYGIPYIKN
jgi:CYTH domain-containing protein